MSIHFNIVGSSSTKECRSAPCFARLKYTNEDLGELLYIHYFPFSNGDEECRRWERLGRDTANKTLPATILWWEHVLSKRFITDCLVEVPTTQEVLEGSGFKVRCDISYRRMMVVLSILRAPHVLLNTRVRTFSKLIEQGIEPDTAFIMAQIGCVYEVQRGSNEFTIANDYCGEHDVFSSEFMTSDDVARFLKIWSGDYKASDLPRSIMYSKTKTYHRYESHSSKAISRYFTKNNRESRFEDSFLGDMYQLIKGSGLRYDMERGRLRGRKRALSLGEISTISGHIKMLKGAQ
jgi:hypothetical protein